METNILLIVFLSLIGVINTSYLSYHAYKKTPVKCLFFPPEWCLKVQQSKFSRTLGVPNAYAGLGMYLALLILSLMFVSGAITDFTPISGIIWIGFLFSMYFTFIQAFVLRAFCTWCVVSAIEFTLLLLTTLFMR
ncbi:MAG: vitamin K epoxide reductase family protein [Patescibacteria group bacterium]